jgi:hypothetical protein
MNRTVQISFSTNLKTSIVHDKVFQQALSYGIMWGSSTHVNIYVDKDGSICCSHQRERKSTLTDNTQPTTLEQYFYMEGIYHAETDTYSFHS